MKRRFSLAALLMNAIILVATVANAGQLFLGMTLAVDHTEYLASSAAVATPLPAPFEDQLWVSRQLVLADLDEIATQQSRPAAILDSLPEVAPSDQYNYPRRATVLFGSIDLTQTSSNLTGDNAGLVEGLFEGEPDARRRTDLHLSFNAYYELMERSDVKASDDFHFGASYHF